MLSFRPMTSRDIGDVLLLERQCFQYPWKRSDVKRCLSVCKCVVAADGSQIVGYAIFENKKRAIAVLTMGVARTHRHQGIGTSLIDIATSFGKSVQAHIVSAWVRERNVDAQLFLRSLGFLCVHVIPMLYREVEEDCYVMEYDVRGKNACPVCNGTGKVQAGKAIQSRGTMRIKEVPCQACRGTGKVKCFTKG